MPNAPDVLGSNAILIFDGSYTQLVAAEAEEAMIRRGAKANANEADRILSIQQLLVENDRIQYSIQIVLEVDIMV